MRAVYKLQVARIYSSWKADCFFEGETIRIADVRCMPVEVSEQSSPTPLAWPIFSDTRRGALSSFRPFLLARQPPLHLPSSFFLLFFLFFLFFERSWVHDYTWAKPHVLCVKTSEIKGGEACAREMNDRTRPFSQSRIFDVRDTSSWRYSCEA